MSRSIAVLLLLVSASAESTLDTQRSQAVAFDLHWNLYIRRLYGCPDRGEMDAATCHITAGITDYREFSKAREQAKKLFDLKD